MTDITETQRELLTRAAAEPEGAIDSPDAKLAKGLVKKGLAISLPVEGGASRLIITEAGRAAICEAPRGGGPESGQLGGPAAGETADAAAPAAAAIGTEEKVAPQAEAASAPTKPKKDAPSGKLGALVALLKRPEGATLDDMVTATGWQVHSLRGAMSGSMKKGFGFVISSEKTDAGRVYKIVAGEAA